MLVSCLGEAVQQGKQGLCTLSTSCSWLKAPFLTVGSQDVACENNTHVSVLNLGTTLHTDSRLSVTGSMFRQNAFPGLRGPPGDPHFSDRFDSDPFRLLHLQGPDLPPFGEFPSFLTHSALSFPYNLTLTHRRREDAKHKLGEDSCKDSRWLGLARPCPKAEPGPRGWDEHLISCGYPHFSVPQPASSWPGPQHCGSGMCCPGPSLPLDCQPTSLAECSIL